MFRSSTELRGKTLFHDLDAAGNDQVHLECGTSIVTGESKKRPRSSIDQRPLRTPLSMWALTLSMSTV